MKCIQPFPLSLFLSRLAAALSLLLYFTVSASMLLSICSWFLEVAVGLQRQTIHALVSTARKSESDRWMTMYLQETDRFLQANDGWKFFLAA